MSAVPVIPARFKDPGEPPAPVKIVSRWEQFLGALATGEKLEDAMLSCFIKRREIQAMVNSGPIERRRYQEAKIAGLRAAYSEFDLDELFNRIAMGMTVKDAYQEVFGKAVHATFYEILRSDPDLEDRYQSCLKTKAVLEVEKVIGIVDDDRNDVLFGDKGPIPNGASVNRSKLKAETRLKLGGTWYRRLYGEKETKVEVNVQVNHAERLEEARARARDKQGTPRKVLEFTDAVFEAKVEEKAMDTTWMEEK
jgi:hypothetical protein